MNLLMVLTATAAMAAYDLDGVQLGASEARVRQHFPHVHCRPLEWRSPVAERRCDDSRIQVGGLDAGVTFWLKKDAVEGFDVRFHTGDWKGVAQALRQRMGAPALEGGDKGPIEWNSGAERARLSADREGRRATLNVWRGDFAENLYRIK